MADWSCSFFFTESELYMSLSLHITIAYTKSKHNERRSMIQDTELYDLKLVTLDSFYIK